MKEEEKELLMTILCYYLPFKLKGQMYNNEQTPAVYKMVGIKYNTVHAFEDGKTWSYVETRPIEEFKPYLRPMSSMTEEERGELRKFCRKEEGILYDIGISGAINAPAIIDFLNAHHFDYRGLIEKDIAIEALKDMYK